MNGAVLGLAEVTVGSDVGPPPLAWVVSAGAAVVADDVEGTGTLWAGVEVVAGEVDATDTLGVTGAFGSICTSSWRQAGKSKSCPHDKRRLIFRRQTQA